ncbi:hypothetical protein T4E_1245 [Trichinella pseudospiralis]|uniref:Uncharacterized protein n=1 Tax=Trichinella pseudospiralis TaxID=6337 RepID=A0A0V0Y5U6_TRIPS|nr:hypothetical protein T4E_1245 [Trichinella pseudospiralis]
MFHAINAAHHGGEKKTFREAQNKWATLHRTGTIWEHLGLRDLLPETDSNRRPVGTTETYPPGGGKCLERRKTDCPSDCLRSVVSCSANRAPALGGSPSLEDPLSSSHFVKNATRRERGPFQKA